MKEKIIAAILSLTAVLSPNIISTAAVSGETSTDLKSSIIQRLKQNPNTINIVYNNQILDLDEAVPVKEDDITYIPFRALMEHMGFEVTYHEVEKAVFASKDDMSVQFQTNSNIVHVKNGDTVNDIELENMIVVKDDLTYIPLQFLNSAMDIGVGEDRQYKCITIADYDGIIESLADSAPNFYKLINMQIPEYNTADTELKISLNGIDDSPEDDFVISGETVSNKYTNAVSSIFKGTVETPDTQNDVELHFIKQGERLYEMIEGDFFFMGLNNGTWYEYEADDFLSDIVCGNMSIIDFICKTIKPEDEVNFDTAVSISALMDSLSDMDKYLSISYEDADNYEICFNAGSNELKEIFPEIGHSGENNINIAYTKSSGSQSEGTSSSCVQIAISFDYFTVELDINSSCNVSINDKDDMIEVPTEKIYLGNFADIIHENMLKP